MTNASGTWEFGRLPQVKQLTTMSSATIYRKIADGSFPAPIKLGERVSVWSRASVEGYIAKCASGAKDGAK